MDTAAICLLDNDKDDDNNVTIAVKDITMLSSCNRVERAIKIY